MTAASSPDGATPPGDLPEPVYRLMAGVLRVGLAIALTILAVAITVLVVRLPHSASASWVTPNPLIHYLDPRVLASGLAHGSAEAYLTLGVYALVATPVVRVVTGIYSFRRHGERRMVALASVVLVLLLVGLLGIGPFVR